MTENHHVLKGLCGPIRSTGRSLFPALLLWLLAADLAAQQPATWEGPVPEIAQGLRSLVARFDGYDVILEPEKNEPEWWAGAPSVVRDREGVFWLACRMRTADSPRGLRGYQLRLLRSEDGVRFETALEIPRESVPIPGFERPALLIDPLTGAFKLYACGPWEGGAWSILKFDDFSRIADFAPRSARPVIVPAASRFDRDIQVLGYKDPVVHWDGVRYHCFVIGYIRNNERIFHFQSPDGELWTAAGAPNQSLLGLDGWHDFFVRPASVVPLGVGYLFVYEGSSSTWYDPVYNIATGLAFTFDFRELIDLTPESPLLRSTTPGLFHTFRYSQWLRVGDELWVYAEVARPNNSNEIRLFRIPVR